MMRTRVDRQESQGVEAGPTLRRGLLLLLQAHDYAQDLERDLWDFAVETQTLRAAELTNNDVRWLVCKGFVAHAREITAATDSRRAFREVGDLVVSHRSCFVLTEEGLEFAREVCRPGAANGAALSAVAKPHVSNGSIANGLRRARAAAAPGTKGRKPNGRAVRGGPVPEWDGARHEFRLGERIVKVFKVPSPNQEKILTAFQEEGWPPRIDDPLPPTLSIDPKQRLHDTIKSLNRSQKHRLIRFLGDGSGQGIRWEVIAGNGRRRAQ